MDGKCPNSYYGDGAHDVEQSPDLNICRRCGQRASYGQCGYNGHDWTISGASGRYQRCRKCGAEQCTVGDGAGW